MDIVELKNKIENNTLGDDVLIFRYSDNKFLCNHYIKHIADNKGKEIQYINSLDDIEEDSDFFEMESPYLRILDVDNFSGEVNPSIKDLIVICKSISKDVKLDYVDITKLLNWHIEDFVKFRLPGLKDVQVKWLCENCKYDIYRLDNECKKLESFALPLQESIFLEQSKDNSYCDLNSNSVFDLTEAIFKKDIVAVKRVLENRDYLDLEPAGLVAILLKNYYKLLVTINSSCWTDSFSGIISEKQYKFYKAVYSKIYSLTELINIYELLTSIDYRLKSGQLDYNIIIDYIIVKIFGV